MLCYVMKPLHVALKQLDGECYVMFYHVMLWSLGRGHWNNSLVNVMSCYIIESLSLQLKQVAGGVMLCYNMLHHVMPHHVMSCYVTESLQGILEQLEGDDPLTRETLRHLAASNIIQKVRTTCNIHKNPSSVLFDNVFKDSYICKVLWHLSTSNIIQKVRTVCFVN